MSTTTYEGILSDGSPLSINVFKGERDDIVALNPNTSYQFSNPDVAEYTLLGLFNKRTTYTTRFIDAKNYFSNIGFTSILDIPDTIYLPKGRSIKFENGYSYYHAPPINKDFDDIDITYSFGGKVIILSYPDTRNYNGSYTQGGYPVAIGLTADKIYRYQNANGNTIYTIASPECEYYTYQPSGVFIPGNIYSFNMIVSGSAPRTIKDPIGPDNFTSSCLSLPRRFRYSGFSVAPALTSGYTSSGEFVDTTDNFEVTLDFFTEFWAGLLDIQYLATVTQSIGGSVTPNGFFASPNEPRMFTVTPDFHHAIFSVAAYNTANGVQIPLQESGMDLQAGSKSYIFTMPAANVSIVVEFRSIEITIPVMVSYTSPRGKVFTTSFNLLYDDTEQREETEAPVEEGE